MAKVYPSDVDTNPNQNHQDVNEENGRHKFTRNDTTVSVDSSIIREQNKEAGHTSSQGFITMLDSQGNIKEVAEDLDVDSFVTTSAFFGRPLGSFVGDNKNRWNPFRKQSGILKVIHAQTKKNRVVSKHGRLNTFKKTDEIVEGHRFLKDFFTSMIDLTWSWTFFSFAASFFFSWLFFAVIWYIIVIVHGDLDEDRSDDHIVCVDNLKDFTSCFLFSLELQHTIGFGGRATTEQCAVAVIVMSLQSIVGVVIQACMAGIVFAKFTKPTNRGETILFSKNALITMRNGALYLLIRIGDIRQAHLIGCQVQGYFVKREFTEEGEVIPYNMSRIMFGSELDGTQESFQMFWPLVLSHRIDEMSPLYDLAPRDILSKQFEIIVTLDGTTQETGNQIQVRSSYLPNEILWGYRFQHTCVAYDKEETKYSVSYTMLNKFVADRTPRFSAKEIDLRRQKRSCFSNYSSISEDIH